MDSNAYLAQLLQEQRDQRARTQQALKQAEERRKQELSQFDERAQKLQQDKARQADRHFATSGRERLGAEQYYNNMVNQGQRVQDLYTTSSQTSFDFLSNLYAQLATQFGNKQRSVGDAGRTLREQMDKQSRAAADSALGNFSDVLGNNRPGDYNGSYRVRPNERLGYELGKGVDNSAAIQRMSTNFAKDFSDMRSKASNAREQAEKKYKEIYGYNPKLANKKIKENAPQHIGGLIDPHNMKSLLSTGRYGTNDPNTGFLEKALGGYSFKGLSGIDAVQARGNRAYGFLSDYLNDSEAFLQQALREESELKSKRLSEKEQISGQLEEAAGQKKVLDAEKGQAKQVSNRRKNTGKSFNPNSQLLSYLTRGY